MDRLPHLPTTNTVVFFLFISSLVGPGINLRALLCLVALPAWEATPAETPANTCHHLSLLTISNSTSKYRLHLSSSSTQLGGGGGGTYLALLPPLPPPLPRDPAKVRAKCQ